MSRSGAAWRRLAGGVLLLPLLMGAARGGSAAKPPPKLVVLIAVDQMRADYLERFAAYFGDQGFRRMMREGSVFTQARYAHASTFTGPGHAVLGSGIYADRSGIVGNRWYSRDTGKAVNCALGLVRAEQPGQCAGEAEAAGSRSAEAKGRGRGFRSQAGGPDRRGSDARRLSRALRRLVR